MLPKMEVTICGIYGLKTVKIAQNLKYRFSPKNGYKIVSEGPLDINWQQKKGLVEQNQ